MKRHRCPPFPGRNSKPSVTLHPLSCHFQSQQHQVTRSIHVQDTRLFRLSLLVCVISAPGLFPPRSRSFTPIPCHVLPICCPSTELRMTPQCPAALSCKAEVVTFLLGSCRTGWAGSQCLWKDHSTFKLPMMPLPVMTSCACFVLVF